MNVRTKKTVKVIAVDVALLLVLNIQRIEDGRFTVTPMLWAWLALAAFSASYTWWFYGPSERATAKRTEREARIAANRAARAGN